MGFAKVGSQVRGIAADQRNRRGIARCREFTLPTAVPLRGGSVSHCRSRRFQADARTFRNVEMYDHYSGTAGEVAGGGIQTHSISNCAVFGAAVMLPFELRKMLR